MIGREFSQGAGSYWSALPSQIYPELREMERLGWIAGRIADDDRLRRRVFRLTEAGQAELRLWVEADNDYPPERDAERVRLIFLDRSDPATIRRHLLRHRDVHQAKAERWRALRDATSRRELRQVAARLAGRPQRDHDLIMRLKLLALDGNIRRAELETDWAEEALGSLENLDQPDQSVA